MRETEKLKIYLPPIGGNSSHLWTHAITGDWIFTELDLRRAMTRALAHWHRRKGPPFVAHSAEWANSAASTEVAKWWEKDDPIDHLAPVAATAILLNHYLRR